MKTIASLSLIFLTSVAGRAQSLMSGSFSWGGDVELTVESKLEPPLPPNSPPAVSPQDAGRLRDNRGMGRFSANPATHEYFGYDARVDTVDAAAGTYRITLSPLSLTPEEMKLPDGATWRSLPPPVFPPPQTLPLGDTMAFTVFESPATGQKVVDYIKLKRHTCSDERPGANQVACLNSLIEDEQKSLADASARMARRRDAATAAAIRDSQPTWEKYRDAACSSLAAEAKRLQCKLYLTRSRTHDVQNMY